MMFVLVNHQMRMHGDRLTTMPDMFLFCNMMFTWLPLSNECVYATVLYLHQLNVMQVV